MDKESMLQAAEDEWLGAKGFCDNVGITVEDYNWHWFWLILAESIWPTPIVEDAIDDFRQWLISGE